MTNLPARGERKLKARQMIIVFHSEYENSTRTRSALYLLRGMEIMSRDKDEVLKLS